MAGTVPPTLPALREWTPERGAFALHDRSRIVIEGAELRSEAELLAEELGLPVAVGAAAGAGDIGLALRDGPLGEEGYRLAVGGSARVEAAASAGAFYGTRTLLQQLRQGSRIPAGTASDWPGYPERGMMLANGEAFIAGHLEAQVRELSYLKLNLLHLHFGDYRWQVQSDRHPEVAAGEGVLLSKAQVRRLVSLADRHHVTVVPEIDMPGHMIAALAHRPELRLEDAAGEPAPDKLDITNPAALEFARGLIEEYLPLFPGPYWHTGADEYLRASEWNRFPKLEAHARSRHGPEATAGDAIAEFINWVNRLVRSHGKTLRVWNDHVCDGRVVRVDPDVVVERWTDEGGRQPDPQLLLDRGHRILNAGWFPTYVATPEPGRVPVDIEPAYETWSVDRFHGGELAARDGASPFVVPADEPRNLGSKLHVWWGEAPELVDPIAHPRLQVIAQKTWGSAAPGSYADFLRLGARVGRAPAGR